MLKIGARKIIFEKSTLFMIPLELTWKTLLTRNIKICKIPGPREMTCLCVCMVG